MQRRQFERLQVSEHAIAVDTEGRTLGRLLEVGGGGMLVELASWLSVDDFPKGRVMRVTVVEPETDVRNTIDAVVRYTVSGQVGFEFVSGIGAV
jgi:hypothetical protein